MPASIHTLLNDVLLAKRIAEVRASTGRLVILFDDGEELTVVANIDNLLSIEVHRPDGWQPVVTEI